MTKKNTSDKLILFFSKFKTLNYKKIETVIWMQDEPQGVYYVKSGYVRMYSIFEDGEELTLNIFKPGSYFPMMWAISNIENSYCYRALTPVELQRAPKEEVLEFLDKNPDELFKLTRRILIGLDGILTNILKLYSKSASSRIMSIIALTAKRFGENIEDGTIAIKIPLTHQDIANLCGVTRETASIEMKRLKEKKLIFYKRNMLIINDIKKLEEEANLSNTSKLSPPYSL